MPRKSLFILGLIVTSASVVGFLMLTRDHGWGDDFAGYILQAQSIVRGNMGELVAKNVLAVQRSSGDLRPGNYPWGFPLMLAPVYALFGVKILAFKLVLTLTYAVFLVAFFFLARTRLSDTESLAVTAALAYNPVLLQEGQGEVLSDIPFSMFSTLAIWLIARMPAQGQSSRRDLMHGGVVGLAVFAAAFVRPNGFLLLVPLATAQIVQLWSSSQEGARSREKALTLAMPYLAFGLLYALQACLFPGSPVRNVSFSMAPVDLQSNAGYYMWLPAHLLHYLGMGSRFTYVAMLIFYVLALVARGRQDSFLHLYMFVTLALYVSFPYQQGARYLYPIWPVFLLICFEGMQVVAGWFGDRRRNTAMTVAFLFWVAMAVLGLGTSIQLARRNLAASRSTPGVADGAFSPGSTAMFDFVKHHTPMDSVIIFFKPRAMSLRAERDSFLTTDCTDLPVGDYLAISRDNGGWDQIAPGNIDSCNSVATLTPVYDKYGFVVYQIQAAP